MPGDSVLRVFLKKPAEIENIVESKLYRDLLDRLHGVRQLPPCLFDDSFANEIGKRFVQVRLHQSRKRFGCNV